MIVLEKESLQTKQAEALGSAGWAWSGVEKDKGDKTSKEKIQTLDSTCREWLTPIQYMCMIRPVLTESFTKLTLY